VDPEMSDIVNLLENELEEAFEVKNKKSLHRYVVLMVDRFARRELEEERESRVVQAIEELRRDTVAGFERIDIRFEKMDQRFEAMQAQMDQRFDAVDKRFEALQLQMDRRFEAVDKRFDDVNKRFAMVVALMSVFFTVLAGMMTVLRLFG
jgi:tetrahydromethanopterin S-methyltransferase subunit G